MARKMSNCCNAPVVLACAKCSIEAKPQAHKQRHFGHFFVCVKCAQGDAICDTCSHCTAPVGLHQQHTEEVILNG